MKSQSNQIREKLNGDEKQGKNSSTLADLVGTLSTDRKAFKQVDASKVPRNLFASNTLLINDTATIA